MKVLEAEKFPRLHSWFNNFKDALVIKERGLLFEYVNQTYLGCISNPRMSITCTNILLYCNLKFQPLDLKYIHQVFTFKKHFSYRAAPTYNGFVGEVWRMRKMC